MSDDSPAWFQVDREGDHLVIETRGLSIRFDRPDDRWTHAILAPRTLDGPPETIARAVEWSPTPGEPDRVAGPVFQEMQMQLDPEGRPQILLLGMSGRHHFSGVFTLSKTANGITLAVDVVDRCRGELAALASTYTVALHSGDLVASDQTSVTWSLDGCRLDFTAGDSTQLALAEAGRGATRVQAIWVESGKSQSRRWQYDWSLIS